MARKRKSKIDQELKTPDHFVGFWSIVGKWLGDHLKPVLAGAGAVVVVVLAGWAIITFSHSRGEHASEAFARISAIASAPLLPESGPAPKTDDDVPHFKTDKERLEAAVKEADSFIASHGGSLADDARLLKGHFLVALGRASEAIPLYTDLTGSLDARLRFLSKDGLAHALESVGQIDKAVEVYSGLAEEAKKQENFFRDRALYQKARLLEGKGAGKDAETLYREILTEVPTTALKDEINDRLAVLEGK